MTEHSLSKLFERMSTRANAPAADLLDADTLVAAAAGTLSGDRRDEVAARLSRSTLQTDLVRMLRELSADSASLANAVNTRESLAHARTGRRVRHAGNGAPRRVAPLRWAGLAACMMLVLGAVIWQPHIRNGGEQGLTATAKPDRIFTSKDRIFSMTDVPSSRIAADAVFRSDFNDG